MDAWLYVVFIEKGKEYNKLTKAIVERHVENLRTLDEDGKLEFCGVFKGYPGVAGMYILKAQSYEEAEALCKLEPLVTEGFAKCKIKAIQVANKENNYLL
ncbi:uncharacterized protein YciI [Breznakia sp. PF5-3]|uniref:YciI family protein n=1 Tax=unclassified Breznakia TaxID=2623764 RepID=UPI0024049DD3|nr:MULTISPECIES: YciI family protein [unclassified Breznakia]MDF9824770.1 uncharacterized protein YciI [Breznakia sp. PM6-1]MDF9835663.1 uncharacterized protein YciI [Breznakia sp. PF5-3]MDF9837712.1 uncharacterized protein YciI [Breznakia sp. PFB2-8]MDF9859673.1 uncharacterized protein YciI [Breznakia sp. PH5-24]